MIWAWPFMAVVFRRLRMVPSLPAIYAVSADNNVQASSAAPSRVASSAAGVIAVGSLIGGWLGAHYGRRLSPGALRAVIVAVGLIGLYRLLVV